mmetsp:Transcript_7922/g.14786  ORF Transcript_7922/g.14786 Transcript_7922/m.14786 type:complete len:213 (+) Transcript_7922:662-1300(+)
MKVMNFVSLSVRGLSALSVNRTRSALGIKSSVNFCCLSSTTFVPGVSTTVTCFSISDGVILRKVPSSCCFISAFSPYFISTTSFVVGTTPVGRISSFRRAFITDDLPALNSPTITRSIASFNACSASEISNEAFPSCPSMSLGAFKSTTCCRCVRPLSMASFSPSALPPASPPLSLKGAVSTNELVSIFCLSSCSLTERRALQNTFPNFELS